MYSTEHHKIYITIHYGLMKKLHESATCERFVHMPWHSIFNISWFNKSEWILKRAHLTPKHTMTLIWSLLLLLAASWWYFWCGCWCQCHSYILPIVSLSFAKLFAFFAPIWNTAFCTKPSCRWKGYSITCTERNYVIVKFWENINFRVTRNTLSLKKNCSPIEFPNGKFSYS